jgi:hypothetical protein
VSFSSRGSTSPSAPSRGYFRNDARPGGLQAWLNENLDQFSHIFSVVDLNRIVDQQQFQWL